MMFDPEQLHDPEFRTRVQAARALIAERVRRGVATPAEHLAVAVLDEMPDEDDPDAVRAWAPSTTFREAVRSAALATLALYVGIVETLAERSRPRQRRDDALTGALPQREDDTSVDTATAKSCSGWGRSAPFVSLAMGGAAWATSCALRPVLWRAQRDKGREARSARRPPPLCPPMGRIPEVGDAATGGARSPSCRRRARHDLTGAPQVRRSGRRRPTGPPGL